MLVGCSNTGTESAQNVSTDSMLSQPTYEEQHIINEYADSLISSYDVIYNGDSSRLSNNFGNSGDSLWAYAVYDMEFTTPNHISNSIEAKNLIHNQKSLTRRLTDGHLFLYYIINELKVRNMPLELAVIPIIESSFNPHAVSSAGARGIWQFTSGTARNFNLYHDYSYDMRRDVIASTDAALNYFEYLYNLFGDWNLAIASYNLGEGTVMKAVNRNKALGKSTDLWSLNIPHSYVERLYLYTDALRNAHEVDYKFPDMPYRQVFKKVALNGKSLNDISNETGVSTDRLLRLNPGFNTTSSSTSLTRFVLVPINNQDILANYVNSSRKSAKRNTHNN